LKYFITIKSIRGAGGGYILSRHPSKIKLSEIIDALEGPICLVDCVDDSDFCNRISICATYEIWKKGQLYAERLFQKNYSSEPNRIFQEKESLSIIFLPNLIYRSF